MDRHARGAGTATPADRRLIAADVTATGGQEASPRARSVVLAVGVAAAVHDPPHEDGEKHEGDEPTDQRPVHGGKHIRGKRTPSRSPPLQACSEICSLGEGKAQATFRRRSWRKTKRSCWGGRRPSG